MVIIMFYFIIIIIILIISIIIIVVNVSMIDIIFALCPAWTTSLIAETNNLSIIWVNKYNFGILLQVYRIIQGTSCDHNYFPQITFTSTSNITFILRK